MRIVIIGNSGSGKSTLARAIAGEGGTPILDLDTLVWEPGQIAQPRDPAKVIEELRSFCEQHPAWIIEGCYTHCAEAVLPYEPELILLEPGKEACLDHCRKRPWEPHKYASKAEQDSKLEFLLGWVADYYERDGDMSLKAHRALFDRYDGPKRLLDGTGPSYPVYTQTPDVPG